MHKLTRAERANRKLAVESILKWLERGTYSFVIPNPPFFMKWTLKKTFQKKKIHFRIVNMYIKLEKLYIEFDEDY